MMRGFSARTLIRGAVATAAAPALLLGGSAMPSSASTAGPAEVSRSTAGPVSAAATASADGTQHRAASVSAVESAALGAGNQRARSLRTVEAFYRALQAKDIGRLAGLWTKDAVYRVPVTAEGVPGQIVGRDAIVSGIGDFFELFGQTRFTWKAEPMLDPRRVMATWALDIELVAGGTYRNRGVAIFQMDGDRIADFSEYFDTAAFLETFGAR